MLSGNKRSENPTGSSRPMISGYKPPRHSESGVPVCWQAKCCSVKGARHRRDSKSCQDGYKLKEEDGTVLLAIADGHGSERCPYSADGASIAAEASLEVIDELRLGHLQSGNLSSMKSYAADVLPQRIVKAWKNKIKKVHEEKKRGKETEADDEFFIQYGTTLLTVLATSSFLIYLQLGDGDILSVAEDASVTRPLPPEKRLLGDETTSLCTPDAWKEVSVSVHPIVENPPALILLSTDGYSNSFVSEKNFIKTGSDYLHLIREYGIEHVDKHLKKWLDDATEQGSGDDITLGLICRRDVPGCKQRNGMGKAESIEKQSHIDITVQNRLNEKESK